jgi:hypothetical protein
VSGGITETGEGLFPENLQEQTDASKAQNTVNERNGILTTAMYLASVISQQY